MNRRGWLLFCFLAVFGLALSLRALAQNGSGQADQAEDSDSAAETHIAPGLQWLLSYGGEPTDQLISDKRFGALLKSYFPDTKMKSWGDKSFSEVAMQFLSGSPDKAVVDKHRYVTASACMAGSCDSRGMVWVDTYVEASGGEPIVVLGMTEPDGKSLHLWLISNKDFYDDPLSTPPDLRVNMGRWLMLPKHKEKIGRFTVIDPSGQEEQDVTPAVLGVPLALVDLGN